MTRRVALLLPFAVCCRAADPAREVLDLIADAAGSLSAGDAAGFLKAFDPAMAGYMKLRENVTGLIAQGEVQSLIDPLEDEGDGRRRVEEFQWTLRIHRGQESANFVRREQVVKCTVEKQGGKWRIVELEPIGFFAPVSQAQRFANAPSYFAANAPDPEGTPVAAPIRAARGLCFRAW